MTIAPAKPLSQPPLDPTAKRLPITAEQSLRVWSSDRWTCRYCSDLVFFPPAFRAMSRRFGNHGYFHPNWKATESPLLIKRGASVDHVVAVTRGGVHGPENFVTACWECNAKKSNEHGWAPRAAPTSGAWDGMLAMFKGIASQDPDNAERRWLQAVRALGL